MPLFNQMNICIVLISVHKDDQYPFWKYNFLLVHLFRAVKCLIPSLLHLCYSLKATEALTREVQQKKMHFRDLDIMHLLSYIKESC